MIVLVPVSLFRVYYEVAEGYPFSVVERLVLLAVSERLHSVELLASTFQMHPRLLIEALISLYHAGWISLSGSVDRQFDLTQAGQRALAGDQLPDSIKLKKRRTNVYFERISGGIVREGEARWVSKKELKKADLWAECLELRPRVFDNRIDESGVQHLLPRGQGQRVRWIGPIELATRAFHYLPVVVITEDERIINYPTGFGSELKQLILEAARAESEVRSLGKQMSLEIISSALKLNGIYKRPRPEMRTWKVEFDPDCLLTTRRSSLEALHEAFQNARSALFLLVDNIREDDFEGLKLGMLSALERGVDVDVLVGSCSESSVLEWLKKTAHGQRGRDAKGRLRFPREISRARGNAVVWDSGNGRFNAAILGSRLFAIQSEEAPLLGVQTSHNGLVSEFCWFIAGLWGEILTESLSSVPTRWRQIAGELELALDDRPAALGHDPSEVLMSFKFDYECFEGVASAIQSTQAELIIATEIASRSFDEKQIGRILAKTAKRLILIFSPKDFAEDRSEYISKAVSAGAECKHLSSTLGDITASDTTVIIGTNSLLSSRVVGKYRDFAISIDGAAPSRLIKDFLRSCVS